MIGAKKNIPNVAFVNNNLNPPLNAQENEFDAIYSLSIITHLSENNHYTWLDELYRVLKPNGILIITSHGDQFKHKLNEQELKMYENGNIVVRETNTEGNRSFTAFQPKPFMEKIVRKFHLLKFIEGNSIDSIHGEQDTWIVQKPK